MRVTGALKVTVLSRQTGALSKLELVEGVDSVKTRPDCHELPAGYAVSRVSPHLYVPRLWGTVLGDNRPLYVGAVRRTGRIVRYWALNGIEDFHLAPTGSNLNMMFYPESRPHRGYHAWLRMHSYLPARLPEVFGTLEGAIRAVTAIAQCSNSMLDNPEITWARGRGL